MPENASKMLLDKLKERGIPWSFWQAVIEVQEEAELYATMHYDVNLRAKIDLLKKEELKIIGEEVHGALELKTIGEEICGIAEGMERYQEQIMRPKS